MSCLQGIFTKPAEGRHRVHKESHDALRYYESKSTLRKSKIPSAKHIKPDAVYELQQVEDPSKKPRKYTDILFLLLILAHWVAMTGIGVSYSQTSNVNALFAPSDYKGRLCGVDSAVQDKPYGYVINSNLDMVCLGSCYGSTKSINSALNAYDNMVCMDEYVKDKFKTATVSEPSLFAGYDDLFDSASGVCNFKVKTFSLGYYCVFDPAAEIPSVSSLNGTKISDYFSSVDAASNALGRFMQDMYLARNWIFGFGFMFSLILAFVFTKFMSTAILDLIIWGAIVATGAFLAALAGYSYTTWESWSEDPAKEEYEVTLMRVLAIIFSVLAGLYGCVVCCLRNRIQLAIQLTKTAGHAVRDVPMSVMFPIIQTAALLLYLVPWSYYMAYANSQGGYCPHDQGEGSLDCDVDDLAIFNSSHPKTWHFDDNAATTRGQYFLIFSYFWTSQFIIAMGQIILALTFFLWYFTPNAPGTDANDEQCELACGECCACNVHSHRGNNLFLTAMCQSWKHAGTAAFGSFIVALVKFARYILTKIQNKMSKSDNKAAKCILCCLQCCLYCLERCIKFINKHAYIMVAIDGNSGFCAAAAHSFFLILRNIRLIAALTVVQEVVAFLGKLFIVAVSGFASYYAINRAVGDQLNSIVGPVLFVMVFAFFVADMFMGVYNLAIDVLMHCFLVDKETHKDQPFAGRPDFPHIHTLSNFVHSHKMPDKEEHAHEEHHKGPAEKGEPEVQEQPAATASSASQEPEPAIELGSVEVATAGV